MSLSSRIAAICAVTVMFVGCVFALAGRADWMWGWIGIALLVAGGGVHDALRWIRYPPPHGRAGSLRLWEEACRTAFELSFGLVLVVAALDAGRFQGSWMPVWLQATAVALFIGGQALATWSMLVNPFCGRAVRRRTDASRGVAETGPYRIVRHPGFTGTIAAYALATPLILGSWWALIPGVVAMLSLVLRAVLEDRMRTEEVEGYADYCDRVPVRLLPFMWMRSDFPPPAR